MLWVGLFQAACGDVAINGPPEREGDAVGDDTDGQASGVPSGVLFDQVIAGDRHGCGVEQGTGLVHCWGPDSTGQVSGVPLGAFITVDAGWGQNCGGRDNGTFKCWGCQGDDLGQCSS